MQNPKREFFNGFEKVRKLNRVEPEQRPKYPNPSGTSGNNLQSIQIEIKNRFRVDLLVKFSKINN
jgi:hypothetical protein